MPTEIEKAETEEGGREDVPQRSQGVVWQPTSATIQFGGVEFVVSNVSELNCRVLSFVQANYDGVPVGLDLMEIIAPLFRIRSPEDR